MTKPQPDASDVRDERDEEGPCTDCWDTGITIQTERWCSCAAGDEFRHESSTPAIPKEAEREIEILRRALCWLGDPQRMATTREEWQQTVDAAVCWVKDHPEDGRPSFSTWAAQDSFAASLPGVEEMREQCAKVAESMTKTVSLPDLIIPEHDGMPPENIKRGKTPTGRDIAAAIRAITTKPE